MDSKIYPTTSKPYTIHKSTRISKQQAKKDSTTSIQKTGKTKGKTGCVIQITKSYNTTCTTCNTTKFLRDTEEFIQKFPNTQDILQILALKIELFNNVYSTNLLFKYKVDIIIDTYTYMIYHPEIMGHFITLRETCIEILDIVCSMDTSMHRNEKEYRNDLERLEMFFHMAKLWFTVTLPYDKHYKERY
jgi:hypothetical protein